MHPKRWASCTLGTCHFFWRKICCHLPPLHPWPGPAQATSNVCITLPDVLELLPEWEGEVKSWSCQVLHTISGQQGDFIPLRTTYKWANALVPPTPFQGWRKKCNPGTAKADGQRAWWQLRLECPNNRALCAGKGQAAMLEQQKLTARGLGGSCREGIGGF